MSAKVQKKILDNNHVQQLSEVGHGIQADLYSEKLIFILQVKLFKDATENTITTFSYFVIAWWMEMATSDLKFPFV